MPCKDYQQIFCPNTKDDFIHRDVSLDDNAFAQRIAATLRYLMGERPRAPANGISTSLQGNLCEFSIWELGEQHWRLYHKKFTWPANAKMPWRDNSQQGIDIIAIDDSADKVYIIEVKSTKEGGSGAIASEENSLKADFRHLFDEGSPEERIIGYVQEAVSDLKIHGQPDLADKVKEAIGHKASECGGVYLIGVVVCQRGETTRSHNARKLAFQELHQWLLQQGWKAEQCDYRSVELSDFVTWLSEVVTETSK